MLAASTVAATTLLLSSTGEASCLSRQPGGRLIGVRLQPNTAARAVVPLLQVLLGLAAIKWANSRCAPRLRLL
jgi:hypothetical protein